MISQSLQNMTKLATLDRYYTLEHTELTCIKYKVPKWYLRMIMSSSNFKETFKSVGAAFFGVQSDKNRERDFTQGKLSHFIIAGVIAVAIFIASLIAIVSLVLPS
jgi:hypothetical protein